MIFKVIINFLATAEFKLEGLTQGTVDGVKGKSLTLNWRISDIPVGHTILLASLYFDVQVPTASAIIGNWDSSSLEPSVTVTGKELFDTRILVSYDKVSGIYNVTLTDLQYNDTGPFLLEVIVGNGSIQDGQSKRSIITISNIKGGHGFRFICLWSEVFDENRKC